MITRFDRLSLEDKLYMIYNKKSFSLPTIAKINFNEEEWMKEIETHIHPEKIKKVINEHKTSCNMDTIKNVTITKKDNPTHLEMNISNKLFQIVDMACETKENIKDILYIFDNIITIIDNNSNVFPEYSGYKGEIVKYFYTVLLTLKLRAHEILVKTNSDNLPADRMLQDFYLKTLRHIIQEIYTMDSKSDKKMAILVYQLCKYLDIDISSLLKRSIINSICSIHKFNPDQLMITVDSLLEEDTDSLTILDELREEDSTMFHNIFKDVKRTIEENYEKNKISSKLSNGGLVIGDAVFDNEGITAARLMIELEMLNKDRLKDYIGNKITSFTIPENDIGYLRLKEKLPVCKIMTKENGFYTLTKYNDKTLLLFKIYGDKNCYGISFPSDFMGERKVVVFDIPTNYEYIMSI